MKQQDTASVSDETEEEEEAEEEEEEETGFEGNPEFITTEYEKQLYDSVNIGYAAVLDMYYDDNRILVVRVYCRNDFVSINEMLNNLWYAVYSYGDGSNVSVVVFETQSIDEG